MLLIFGTFEQKVFENISKIVFEKKYALRLLDDRIQVHCITIASSSSYLAINQRVVSSTLFASLQVAVKSRKKSREAYRVQTHKSRFVLNPCASTLTRAVFITSGSTHVARKCLLRVLTCLIYRPRKEQQYENLQKKKRETL